MREAGFSGFSDLGPSQRSSEHSRTFVREIERFAAKHIDASAIDEAHSIPRDVLRGLADLGMFGLSIPEEYGGTGLDMHSIARATAALAKHDRSVATAVGLHLGLGTRGLVAFGSDAVKARYLPSLARGDAIAAFATTESEAGSDLSAIRTEASECAGGCLRVRGSKIFVTNAHLADLITITASTPGLGGARRGQSLILLERTDPGVGIAKEERKLGLRGSSTASIFLDDVVVPMDRIVGEAGKGSAHLSHVLAWGRTLMAAGCIGAAATALERTIEHVNTRVQFGRTIGSFEVVRRQVAKMAAVAYAMGAIVRHTCSAETDRELLLVRSLAAKIFCSEGVGHVADMAVQLHGGSGFIEETGIALLLRDARITRIFEGANDVLAGHLGAIESTGTMRRAALETDASRGFARRAAPIREALLELCDGLRKEHGIHLVRRQGDLHRVGRIAMWSQTADAVATRAEAEGSETSTALAEHFFDIADAEVRSLVATPIPAARVDELATRLYEGFPR